MFEELSNPAQSLKTLLPLIKKQGAIPISRLAGALRKKPVVTPLPELERLIAALLASQKEPVELLNAIESLRSDIHRINPGDEGVASQEDIIRYLQLLDGEAKIYERLVRLTNGSDMEIFSLAVHRGIAALMQRQLICYRNYLPMPEKECLRMHSLFYLAIQKSRSGFTTVEKMYFMGKKLSIWNLYAISLLMGCGRLNHLSPTEISRVSTSMLEWCKLVSISRKSSASSKNQLVVDLSIDSAPDFKERITFNAKSYSCYLQLDKLIEKFDRLLADETKGFSLLLKKIAAPAFGMESQALKLDVILHLKLAWTKSRSHPRLVTNEDILACRGFESIFFYLAGGQTLKEFIGDKAAFSIVYNHDIDVGVIKKQRSGDIWSSFLSAPVGSHISGVIPAEMNFQKFFANKNQQNKNTDHPVFTIKRIDSSPDGCRLLWTTPSSNSPSVGELVGLCADDLQGHWHVGEIIWKDQSGAGEISTGVHLLSTMAIPVAVDVPLRHGSHENYTGGMLFPPEKQIGTDMVSFVLSSLKLEQGEYVAISQKGVDEKIYLNKPLKTNAFFESHECAFVMSG